MHDDRSLTYSSRTHSFTLLLPPSTSSYAQFEWKTEGALSHTTMEVRDAKSHEVSEEHVVDGLPRFPEMGGAPLPRFTVPL